MPSKISGLHHVTAIASDPQRNLDFYVGLLGLRLVKRTINFDDPGTYHFYFADGRGTPGTILTFFPWPGAQRGRRGTGQVETTAFAIVPGSTGYWVERLKAHQVSAELATRFGEEVIGFLDPDGMMLELVVSPTQAVIELHGESSVPKEHALRGFHSVSAALEGYERTAKLLTETFGYQLVGEDGNRFRFASHDETVAGRFIDLLCKPDSQRAGGGAGSVHHIAFRVRDDKQQTTWRETIVNLGYNVSPVMDRTYFHSIYFREPGGVLFVGSKLRLPPWLETSRAQIEKILPPLTFPAKAAQ
jgi:catechol 2,3-dioxygenase-like lactoylglutathione lyase family enzyme